MKPYTFLFVGPPGSGKGTQAEKLSQRLSLPHIDVGHLLRTRADATDAVGKQIRALMNAGRTVPEDLVLEILLEHLSTVDQSRGLILDGYCRTKPQVSHLIDLQRDRVINPVLIISIQVPEQDLLARITAREYCVLPNGDEKLLDNQITAVWCQQNGGHVTKRTDDNQNTFQERLATYHEQTMPAIEELDEHWQQVIHVDGTKTIPEVEKSIYEELKNNRWA